MDRIDDVREYADAELARLVPWPARDANKYSRGKVVLVAGCERYPGAACLAARASQRMGAGYTHVLCAPESVACARGASPSLVVEPWTELLELARLDAACGGYAAAGATVASAPAAVPAAAPAAAAHAAAVPAAAPAASASAVDDAVVFASTADGPAIDGDFAAACNLAEPASASAADAFPLVANDLCLQALRRRLFAPARPGHPVAYAVGSGLDADAPESAALVGLVLASSQAPVVVDGGGLAAMALPSTRAVLARRGEDGWPTVITPHAGEAARLAASAGLAMGDGADSARRLARAYGVVCVLKGPVTYISDGQRTARMPRGTSALAKAGTGDVLAGMAAALLAQGLEAMDGCVLAASLHADAGRAAARRLTDVCVTAEDVVEAIPCAMQHLAAARK